MVIREAFIGLCKKDIVRTYEQIERTQALTLVGCVRCLPPENFIKQHFQSDMKSQGDEKYLEGIFLVTFDTSLKAPSELT
jgi:hypothetical protein